VADVFRAHGPAYLDAHVLPPHVAKVLRAVIACRTSALGGHLWKCDSCESSPVCWTNLTEDLQGDEVDPTSDIDILRLLRFSESSQEEVIDQLADNTLPQFELTGYVDYEP